METTEKIVESYCRYTKGWFTIPNIKCRGQFEIDLLAINPRRSRYKRYHIESGVSISGSYSRLNAKKFSQAKLKTRGGQAGQRRTMGYFIKRKFGAREVKDRLLDYGFSGSNYKRVIVTWGYTEEAEKVANKKGILLWDFRDLVREIADGFENQSAYFTDDTLRTLQLFARSQI